MEPTGVGVLIGVGVISFIVLSVCLYDKLLKTKDEKYVKVFNPLLQKKSSFKVKNLFSHVEI